MPMTYFRQGVYPECHNAHCFRSRSRFPHSELAKLQTSGARRGRGYSSIMNHETDCALHKESRPDTWSTPSPTAAVMTVSGRKYLLQSVAHPVNCTQTADVVWSVVFNRWSATLLNSSTLHIQHSTVHLQSILIVSPSYSIRLTIESQNRVNWMKISTRSLISPVSVTVVCNMTLCSFAHRQPLP